MKNYLIVLFLVVVSIGILTIGINKPLNGHHDWNDRYFSQIARNYIKYGPIELKFGQLIGDSLPQSKDYYTHHPQLFPLILAGGMLIFGDHAWTIRLMPIIFSTATIGLFYLLLRKYYSLPAAIIACLFIFATPMFDYFGKMADHEAFTLFFIVLTLYAYVTKRPKLTLLALFLGQWTGWPAYYLGGLLFLWSRQKRFLILSVINFCLFLINIYVLMGTATGGGLIEVLLFRMGFTNLPGVIEEYTNSQLLSQEIRWGYHFFTPPMFILSLLALLVSLIKKKINPVWLIFGAIAVTHVVLFRTGAWRHDYWLYYFLPFFAWGIAAGISLFEKKFSYLIYLVYFGFLAIAIYQSQPFFWALQTMVEKTF